METVEAEVRVEAGQVVIAIWGQKVILSPDDAERLKQRIMNAATKARAAARHAREQEASAKVVADLAARGWTHIREVSARRAWLGRVDGWRPMVCTALHEHFQIRQAANSYQIGEGPELEGLPPYHRTWKPLADLVGVDCERWRKAEGAE